jgi:hypothetical protein
MKIDRSRFLLLASALAGGTGGACAATPPASSAAAPVASSTATATPEPSTPPSRWARRPPSGEGYYPSGEGYYPSGEGYVAPIRKPQRPFNRTQCAGDDIGSPGVCTTLKEDASCAPFDFVRGMCASNVTFMKARVAERAVACQQALGAKKLCDSTYTWDCRDEALRSACADASADAVCGAIAQKCPVNQDECRGYLAGLNDGGRQEVAKCLETPDGCRWGVWSCVEGL